MSPDREWFIERERAANLRMDKLIAERIHEIISAVEANKNVPSEALAWLLRSGVPLSKRVRWYLAGRIEGTLKHRGRPLTKLNISGKFKTDPDCLRAEHVRKAAELRTMKKRDPEEYAKLLGEHRRTVERNGYQPSPRTVAIAILADEEDVSYHAMRDIVGSKP